MSSEVKWVGPVPNCDFCSQDGLKVVSEYDAKTKFGPWANMCERHFKENGFGRLGTGYGQKILPPDPKDDEKRKPSDIFIAEILRSEALK